MTSEQVFERLKRILLEDLDLNLSDEDLDKTVRLFEGGLALDSVVAVELIGFVEKRFGIELPEEVLRMEAFKDLQSVVELIQEQLTVRKTA